jgi:hypothetical protein
MVRTKACHQTLSWAQSSPCSCIIILKIKSSTQWHQHLGLPSDHPLSLSLIKTLLAFITSMHAR